MKRITLTKRIGLFLAFVCICAGSTGTVLAEEEGETLILATGSYWRAFAMSGPEIIPQALWKEVDPKVKEDKQVSSNVVTSPPPKGWTACEYDDSWWIRSPGPINARQGRGGAALSLGSKGSTPARAALLCLRGTFKVNDPAGIKKLTLALDYIGGVIVYLNGTEIYRAYVPKKNVLPLTPAEWYPKECYVNAKGVPKITKEEKGKRIRKAVPLAVPVKLLKKGMNVLAVEAHRSGFRPEALKWKGRYSRERWPHRQLNSIRLAADCLKNAVIPNIQRPDGIQVWNQDSHRIFSVIEYGDPYQDVKPIKLSGAKNGYYSATVVVGSTAPITEFKAAVTDLTGKKGGKISVKNIQIRYGTQSKLGISASHSGLAYRGWQYIPAFCVLKETPPAKVDAVALKPNPKKRENLGLPSEIKKAALIPVWITVNIPPATDPGVYTGTLSLAAKELPPKKIPVEIEVINWALPDTGDYAAYVSIYQSPESVALQYNAPLWSDKHWEHMVDSCRLLGYVSNKLMVIPLVNHTQFGNDESVIPWIRQKNGSYTYDFSIFNAYAAMMKKYCKIKVISYQVYLSSGWTAPGPDKPTHVTVIDAATKKKEKMKLPAYGTQEAEKLWAPFIKELQMQQKKAGLGDAITVFGIAQDGGIHRTVVDFFKKIIPKAKWHYGAHNRPNSKREREVFSFAEYLYVPWHISPPETGRKYGWKQTPITVMCQRMYDRIQTPMMFRTMAERGLLLGDSGAGRMCIDYWPVKGSTKYSAVTNLFDRWVESKCGQRQPQVSYMSAPGEKGALSTIKIEAFREGIQGTEARIFIEKALVNKKITGTLAEKCQTFLDRRAHFFIVVHSNGYPIEAAYNEGWQKSYETLYRLAGEVARQIGKK